MIQATPPFPATYTMPLVLSNGIDFCHVDCTTGTIGFKDHIKGCLPFWYRKGRPHGPDPLALLRLPWQFVTPSGPVEVGAAAQEFDPLNAVVATTMIVSGAKLRLTAFLMEDCCYVEHFEVLESTRLGCSIQLVAECPRAGRTHKPVASLSSCDDAEFRCSADADTGVIDFGYAAADTFRGRFLTRVLPGSKVGRIRVKVVHVGSDDGDKLEQPHDSHSSSDSVVTTVEGLQAGTVFSRITVVRDSKDADDWEKQLVMTLERVCGQTPDQRLAAHQATRGTFVSASLLRAGNPALSRRFDVSMYTLRASLHPNGSSVSALSLPNDHHMGTYWDTWYGHAGLVRFNRIAEARRIVDFWHLAWPTARRIARESYDCPGARFEWVLRVDGEPAYQADQVHNNLIPVITIFDHYEHTLDREFLVASFPLMLECMSFLTAFALRYEEDGTPYLREVSSVDESLLPKRNELMTAVALARGIEVLTAAAEILGEALPDELAKAEPAVASILDGLWTGKALHPYEGGSCANWAIPLTFIHHPNPERFALVIDDALQGCAESHGLGIGHDSRMRCAAWPWVEGIFAWAMIRNGDSRGLDWLERMWAHTNIYGGLPEYLWVHGEPSRDGFVAAHGVYLAALAELLVTRRGGDLHVADACQLKRLGSINSVKGLRLPGALLLDITRAGDDLELTLHNTGDQGTRGDIFVGGRAVKSFSLGPGTTDRIVTGALK